MTVKYFDLGVHSLPECADSPKRLKLVSQRYGFANIAITNHSAYWEPLESGEVISGVEIVADDVHKLRKLIKAYREQVTILAVHGGNEKINRGACNDARVDILMHPERGNGNGLNHIMVKLAAKHNVTIGFTVDYLSRHRGPYRAKLLAFQRKNLVLCRKFAAKIALSSGALSHYDFKTPREITALSTLIGMDEQESESALSTIPEGIVNHHLFGGW